MNKELIQKVQQVRNELYDSLPTGEISAWSLLQIINSHIKKLDKITEELPSTEEAPLQDNLEDTELGKRFTQILKDYNNGYGATIEETAHALVELSLTQFQEVRDKFMEFLESEKTLGISDKKTIERIQWYYKTYFIQPASNETPVKEEKE